MRVSPRQAQEMLTQHNSNDDLNSPEGLEGLMCRFVQFNGAVSADQLNWLDSVLQMSDDSNECVLVASMSVHRLIIYHFVDNHAI